MPTLTAGDIAFVGPTHVPSLENFTYVRVTKVHGTSATVRRTGPDSTEESPEFDVKVSSLRHRIVSDDETEHWPGSYVGHPIAFVQTNGEASDQWAYGLVTGYSMDAKLAQLHVRCGTSSLRVGLTTPPTIIAVDRLNYALQTGASLNVMALNALELLDRQNEVIVACGKSRSGLPVSVTTTMLSVPFNPEEIVSLIKPDTLEIVSVRRQHIVDCELDGRSSNHSDVFTDTQATSDAAQLGSSPDMTNNINLAFSDSDDEGKTEDQVLQRDDINSVRFQNRSLHKRYRPSPPEEHDDLILDQVDIPVLQTTGDAQASAFRPSAMEKLVHDAVVHPSLLGKNPQFVIESAQQGPRTKFLATPPVLRLAYDLSFGIRGLSVMHFRRFIQELEPHSSMTGINMTNFGRSNALQPASPPSCLRDIVDAFETLLLFAQGFYNNTVYDFIKTGAAFMARMSVLSQPDVAACNMLVHWINSKLGKFRSEIIASNLQTAVQVGLEFTRKDDHLMELYEALQQKQRTAQVLPKQPRGTTTNRPNPVRTAKQSTVPRELLDMLPKQGHKTLCMRYLSKKGCTGPTQGHCFDPSRAHFKPLALPADAKAYIDKNFDPVCHGQIAQPSLHVGCGQSQFSAAGVHASGTDLHNVRVQALASQTSGVQALENTIQTVQSSISEDALFLQRGTDALDSSETDQYNVRVQALASQTSGVQALENENQTIQPSLSEEELFIQRGKSALDSFHRTQTAIRQASAEERDEAFRQFAERYGVQLPNTNAVQHGELDKKRISAVSSVARRSGLELAQFVRVYRHQTPSDPRPNKDLFELTVSTKPEINQLTTQWNSIVRHGVVPAWKPTRPARQLSRPSNHKIPAAHYQQVRDHIFKGEQEGRYLVVEADLLNQWPEIYISPVGVTEKSQSLATIRVINDYSYPPDASVNDFTDRSTFPEISYNPPRDIARRIFELRTRFPSHVILIMLGDVSGAFRHIPVAAEHVHMFGFRFDGCIVIDLACGFGWCGSPAFYAVAGSLIDYLYQQQRPHRFLSPLDSTCFVGNYWCDDHTCLEVNTGTRCEEANWALRKAMATVLGPTAVNEKKFTGWSTELKALGLMWNTVSGTVAVPDDKIAKARLRIQELLHADKSTRSTINKLLGSLRYVSTCFPPARAFYQNLQVFVTTFPRHHVRHQLPKDVREDLRWYLAVLTQGKKFNSIPVEHFAQLLPPSRHVFMDASDTGVCVLEPQLKQYIRVQFSEAVRQTFAVTKTHNSINVRELMGPALAALHWGPSWTSTGRDKTHVRMWIDNTSAVAWLEKRASQHPIARAYNRLISLAEFQHSFSCSAAHIPGDNNTMADAGSRAWSANHSLYPLWTNLSNSWTQIQILPPFDDLLSLWETCSADMLSQVQLPGSWSPWITEPGRAANKKLGCFAVYCWKYGWNKARQGNTFGTIKLKLASIRWYHKSYIGIDLTASPDFTVLLQGIKRLSPPVHKLQPITPAFLRLLYHRLDLQQPQHRLLWGSVLVGFFFLLRRSEYLRIGQARHFYCLKHQNVFFSDAEGKPTPESKATSVTIGLEGAKNDQFGRGAWRTMHSSGDPVICPVIAVKHLNIARRKAAYKGRYLCGDLTAATMAKAFKATAKSIGVPEANYSTHSVRIGGATALLSGQASSTAIKLLGRWLSNCFEQYPTQSAISTSTLSRRMVGAHTRQTHS